MNRDERLGHFALYILSLMSPRGLRALIAAMQECGWLADIQPDISTTAQTRNV